MRITVRHILAWQARLDDIAGGPDALLHDRLRAFISDFRAAHEDDPKSEEILDELLSWMYE